MHDISCYCCVWIATSLAVLPNTITKFSIVFKKDEYRVVCTMLAASLIFSSVLHRISMTKHSELLSLKRLNNNTTGKSSSPPVSYTSSPNYPSWIFASLLDALALALVFSFLNHKVLLLNYIVLTYSVQFNFPPTNPSKEPQPHQPSCTVRIYLVHTLYGVHPSGSPVSFGIY